MSSSDEAVQDIPTAAATSLSRLLRGHHSETFWNDFPQGSSHALRRILERYIVVISSATAAVDSMHCIPGEDAVLSEPFVRSLMGTEPGHLMPSSEVEGTNVACTEGEAHDETDQDEV